MNKSSPYGGLAGRTILIRKKLTERKRFDSADYCLGYYGNKNASNLEIAENCVDEHIRGGDASCVSPGHIGGASCVSPGHIGAKMFRDGMENVSAKEVVSPRNKVVQPENVEGKYGKLGVANLLIRRKLTDKQHFDSADYSMMSQGVRGAIDVGQLDKYGKKVEVKEEKKEPQKEKGAGNYGQLCARNILLRKKLSERRRFDSADYFSKGGEAALDR